MPRRSSETKVGLLVEEIGQLENRVSQLEQQLEHEQDYVSELRASLLELREQLFQRQKCVRGLVRENQQLKQSMVDRSQ